MSTQQIPTVAQIVAARLTLWRQSTSESGSLASNPAVEDDTRMPSEEQPAAVANADEPAIDFRQTDQPQEVQAAEAEGSPDAEVSNREDEQTASEAAPDDAPDHTPDLVAAPSPASSAIVPPVSIAILTQTVAREFLNRAGLLLFAPRSQFSGVPAPTFVEATLGTRVESPSLAATATARALLAHLVAEGSAVPLNLLGLPTTTGEAPDFICSAAAFPYLFTLRGDKAWKQPPATSGAIKVSPLAANTYALLIENGPRTAYMLAGDLGKEVTEAAVLRALSELWGQLRVLPVPQPQGKPTVWEPVATRFTKQIKTGANAGQPTALSALISLYLGQALLATEDEIETFLSPVAPRSRVRDALHGLSAGRQLETIAIAGKQHLHIAGDLPLFTKAPAENEASTPVFAEDGSRIRKFVAKPRKLGTGYAERSKPFRTPGGPSRAPDGRPARKPAASRFSAAPDRPAFNKPWEEEMQERAGRAAGSEGETPEYQDIDMDAGAPPAERQAPAAGRPAFGRKPAFGSGRPAFGSRPRSGGDRPAFSRDRPAPGRFNADRPARSGPRDGAHDRPAFNRGGDSSAPRFARRDFAASAGEDGRPPRKPVAGKPAFGSKPGFAGKAGFTRKPFDPERANDDRERRPFRRDAEAGEGRPPRRSFPAPDGGRGNAEGRSFAPGKPRSPRDRDAAAGGGRPPFRKFDAPRRPREDGEGRPPRREFDGERPSFPRAAGPAGAGKPFAKKPFGAKPFVRRDAAAGDGPPPRRTFAPREGGFTPREGAAGPRREGGFTAKKPFAARSAGPGERGSKPFAKKSFSRSTPDAPGASTFDKFKGGNKPWGKRPPARKYKPKGDQA